MPDKTRQDRFWELVKLNGSDSKAFIEYVLVLEEVLKHPDAQERRRYELLKVAATLYAADMRNHFDTWTNGGADPATYVASAEQLLAEIEKREKAERP